nr:MAG TPA: hypothetical protein [Caudoviricetes sp.]
MKRREIDIAARFGLLDHLQALENDLQAIPGTTYIDFDLSGLYDHCPLCFVVGYDIDTKQGDYFEVRQEWIKAVIVVFGAHDLHPTGDTIEDYGASYYFVRRMGQTWEEVTPA